ncbi:homoserine O-succinyltransferase MetA [Methylobacterium sp. Leaf112]|uniref:homoserine O-succinyltransferase MetA n=1 Tax=Methylobacterium sp. Leaf112 TaxID=1736258 RepID=UPI0006F1D633|nr:homoserine O-succinyltransferase [Methylobacterium sp. Leaf112]KQP71997.1 homoserine O-succinyltransferase [Methylobacterium sp. Leaf112]
MLDHAPSEVPSSRPGDGSGLRADMPSRAVPVPPLRIGLLNNMPDAAFLQTERQFRRLVGPQAMLSLFAFRDLPRAGLAAAHARAHYESHRALPGAGLDALVVTGCEPVAPHLEDEPFYAPLSAVVDWAAENTVSTLFSCLASHAAVLHRDGIRRRPRTAKLSGVYPCACTPHPLLAGLPDSVAVPHSRWNDLPEDELVAAGYTVLRRSDAIGVDLFVREAGSLLVFLQGHPEYDTASLAREYRRDVFRFLDGQRATLPALPENYFSDAAAARLDAFARRAAAERRPDLFAAFPNLADTPLRPPAWPDDADRLFRNWVAYVARHRADSRAVR